MFIAALLLSGNFNYAYVHDITGLTGFACQAFDLFMDKAVFYNSSSFI